MFIEIGPLFVGNVGERSPATDDLPAALGVVNGDPGRRDGDDRDPEIGGLNRVDGTSALLCCVRLSVGRFGSLVLSCRAVIVMYFDAREPAVILSERD